MRKGSYKSDLTGKYFGWWTVIGFAYFGRYGAHWRCRCDCGAERIIVATSLQRGASNSCGCLIAAKNRARTIDLTGQRFGRLTVLEHTGRSQHKCPLWQCLCDCGTIIEVRGDNLRASVTHSCGCYFREVAAEACRYKIQNQKIDIGIVAPVDLETIMKRLDNLHQ